MFKVEGCGEYKPTNFPRFNEVTLFSLRQGELTGIPRRKMLMFFIRQQIDCYPLPWDTWYHYGGTHCDFWTTNGSAFIHLLYSDGNYFGV